MTESEYLGHLELRISRELAGMREKQLRSMWCDGFLPEREYVVTATGSHIAGQVWLEAEGKQSLWNFVVLLGRQRVQREHVEWAKALPEDDQTGWLHLDFAHRFLKVKLSAYS